MLLMVSIHILCLDLDVNIKLWRYLPEKESAERQPCNILAALIYIMLELKYFFRIGKKSLINMCCLGRYEY